MKLGAKRVLRLNYGPFNFQPRENSRNLNLREMSNFRDHLIISAEMSRKSIIVKSELAVPGGVIWLSGRLKEASGGLRITFRAKS